jgi:two-component system, OmpR family, response regulator
MGATLDNLTVLIVDDDPDFLLQQETNLKAAGVTVITAESRKDAEALLDDQRPDIAIIDLMMEEMDGGFVLSYSIKKKDPTIPVIIVSAVTNESGYSFDAQTDEEKSWVKADAFLAKPIRFEQLKYEIERLVK